MDIKELYTSEQHEAGAEMQVNDENGKPLDLFITLAGRDSRVWKTAEIEMKRMLYAGADSVDTMSDAMAKISLGWRGFQSDGVDLEFTKESVRNLYASAPYIAEQADKFLSDRANFTKRKEAS